MAAPTLTSGAPTACRHAPVHEGVDAVFSGPLCSCTCWDCQRDVACVEGFQAAARPTEQGAVRLMVHGQQIFGALTLLLVSSLTQD